jgi:hypothetical protein
MAFQVFEADTAKATRGLAATADLLDTLDHPGIPTVVAFDPIGQGGRLTLRPGGGTLLSEWLPGDPAAVASVMAAVAETVAHLHDAGIHLRGIHLAGISLTADCGPVLSDPTGWLRSGPTHLAPSRRAQTDLASFGRALNRLLAVLPDTPGGWQGRLGHAAERRKALAALARSAESGRQADPRRLAAALISLGQAEPGAATPSVRSRVAAASTSTARMAARSRRSLPRIVSSAPAKS